MVLKEDEKWLEKGTSKLSDKEYEAGKVQIIIISASLAHKISI